MAVHLVEVTPLLRAAAGGLGVGELLQIPAFSLFEAMSAMEIGHEKMDPGVGGGRGGGAAAAAEEGGLLAAAMAAVRDGGDEQLLRVFDHLLAQEATHLSGGGLANTVYSSLFMMEIDRLGDHPVLQAYCRGVQETCLEAHYLVMQGCACEEEDFNVHLVGLPLEAAAAEMCAAPHAQRERSATADCVAALDAAVEKVGSGSALADRLLFRRDFIRALSALRGKQEADLAAAAKALGEVARRVVGLRASSGGGGLAAASAAGREREEGEKAAAAAAAAVPGYVETLNNHLTPPVPPRQLKVLSTGEAFNFYERLVQELMRVTTIPTAIDDFPSLKQFVEDFAQTKPLALSRSALHLQLAPRSWETGDQGTPPKWVLTADMLHAKMLGLPLLDPASAAVGAADASAIPPPPPLSSADLGTLLEQAVIAVGNWLQATLLNRARQRRRLRRGCEDMANLYQHALIAEACPLVGAKMVAGGWRWQPLSEDDPGGPLATWVEKETAWHMCSHLLMGFELELVEAGEVPMLFWYADYLLATMQQCGAALAAARPWPDDQRRQQQLQQQQQTLRDQAMRAMCQGMFRLGLLLNNCGAVGGGGGGGGDGGDGGGGGEERFEVRFGFFATSVERPAPLTFAQYRAASDISSVPMTRVAELAVDSFTRAAAAATASGEASLARVAKMNGVAAAMVRGALLQQQQQSGGGGALKLRADYALKGHPSFPTVSLKSK